MMIIFVNNIIYLSHGETYFVQKLQYHNTLMMALYATRVKGLVSKGTVVLRRWENQKLTFRTNNLARVQIGIDSLLL